jgi:L-alanine-DL-glutamate epimerase-like enolase superfamily enzyme
MRFVEGLIYSLRIPFVEAFSHSTKSRNFSASFIVRLTMYDGTVGYGEGVSRPYVTGESVESSIDHIQHTLWPSIAQSEFSRITPGPDPIDSLSQVYRALPDTVTEGVVAFHAARTAVEIAIVDGILKRQQMSLSQLLPPKRTEVVYSGVITAGSIEKAEQHARHFKLFGIKQLKIKIGGPDSVARVEAVRQTVGPDASLRVDANGDYNVAGAIALLADLAPFNIASVEQPIPRRDPIDLASVRRNSTIPIMADESLVTLEDARALIAANACDYFNLRLSKCGGIVRTLEMARLAADAGLRVQLGSQVGETAVLSAAGRHVAAYLDDVAFVEGSYGSLLLTEDIGKDSINFGHGGRAGLLRGHGLGVRVVEDVLIKYAQAIIPLA